MAALHSALGSLWRTDLSGCGNLYATSNFRTLREVCQKLYPKAGGKDSLDFALGQALGNLGLSIGGLPPIELDTAAQRLDAAFRQTITRRTYLCPLDGRDELPDVAFGPNRLRTFTPAELADLVDPDRLARNLPRWQSNIGRLSRFAWLVVTECVSLPGEPGARALPLLYESLGQDFGRIEPHKPSFPDAVEAALFALLMVPWEDVVVYPDVNWRPFSVPWVLTVSDDLFAHQMPVPDADTLSWEPDFYEDACGENIESDRPFSLPLSDGAPEAIRILDDAFWVTVTAARSSPISPPPLAHFLVRAFASQGIDEFLAHITVVEAALGLPLDHDQRLRQPIGKKNPGATTRVSWRLAGLLNDPDAGERYRQLFRERSNFLHGRIMSIIPGRSRLDARRIARRCVCVFLRRHKQPKTLTIPTPFFIICSCLAALYR